MYKVSVLHFLKQIESFELGIVVSAWRLYR